jgi:hypothetical protein
VCAGPGSGHDGEVDDWVTIATGLLAGHPAVTSVKFAGSRSRGTHDILSDWDFAVETPDFNALARDLPSLVAPLKPLSQQWEPLGHFPVYQVLLPGPTKIEYLFLNESQEPLPRPIRARTPWPPSTRTSGTGPGGSQPRPRPGAATSSQSTWLSSMHTSCGPWE